MSRSIKLRTLYPQLVADITERLDAVAATVTRDATTDLLLINGEFSATMVLSMSPNFRRARSAGLFKSTKRCCP